MKWDYVTPGIPDDLFERREDVPITKEDIRALVISKLRLRDDFQVIDVGCGSGRHYSGSMSSNKKWKSVCNRS